MLFGYLILHIGAWMGVKQTNDTGRCTMICTFARFSRAATDRRAARVMRTLVVTVYFSGTRFQTALAPEEMR